MSQKKTFSFVKKIAIGFLAMSMVASGVNIVPTTVDAANTTTVMYEDRTSEFNTLWKADGTSEAPTEVGYLFGGWYEKTGEDAEGKPVYAALTVETAQEKKNAQLTSGVFAKFVPDYVLSVKAQNEEGTIANDDDATKGYTSVRVISSVDSKEYKKVGFRILLNNSKELLQGEDGSQPLETTRIYDKLQVGSGNTVATREAKDTFGAASQYFSVWRLDDIIDDNDKKIINVRPYWITMDGTKVEGLSKFVHIEDGYMNYISVPINLTTGEAVAAGALSMKYDASTLTFYGVEYGNVFKEMKHNNKVEGTEGTLKLVGNTDVVDEPKEANDIYANVRFTVNSNSSYAGVGRGEFLTFQVGNEEFCDWSEAFVTMDSADIQY